MSSSSSSIDNKGKYQKPVKVTIPNNRKCYPNINHGKETGRDWVKN